MMSRTVGGVDPYPALMLLRKPRPTAPAVPRPSLLTAAWMAMMAAGLCLMLRPTLAAILGGG